MIDAIDLATLIVAIAMLCAVLDGMRG